MNFCKLIIGDSKNMKEVETGSVNLIITSPPYYDMRGAVNYESYEKFLELMQIHFNEMFRVIAGGRYCCINIADYCKDGKIYPIPFDFHHQLTKAGFVYEGDIIWQKPSGMTSSKSFGCFVQNPYPMYYHPATIYEHILIFRKWRDFTHFRRGGEIDWTKYIDDYKTNIWKIQPDSDEEHGAIFPEKLPELLMTFYSYPHDIILDPFLGTGTTMRVARAMNRSCIGYEIEEKYLEKIKCKVGWNQQNLTELIEYSVIKKEV